MSARRAAKPADLSPTEARKLAALEYATYLRERVAACKTDFYCITRQTLKQLPSVKRVQTAPPPVQAEFLMLGVRKALKGYKPPTDNTWSEWDTSTPGAQREIAIEGPVLLLGRSLPLGTPDLERLVYAQTSRLFRRGTSSIGGLLKTIQSALNGKRPEGKLRRLLEEWKKNFAVHYGSDFASLKARLDDILEGQEPIAKATSSNDTPDRTKAREQGKAHFSSYMSERLDADGWIREGFRRTKFKEFPPIRRILDADRIVQAEFVMVCLDHCLKSMDRAGPDRLDPSEAVRRQWVQHRVALEALAALSTRALPFTLPQLKELLIAQSRDAFNYSVSAQSLLRWAEGSLNSQSPTGDIRTLLFQFRDSIEATPSSNSAAIRAHFDRVLDPAPTESPAPTHAGKARAAKSRSEAIELLVKSATEAWQLVPAGRPLKLSHTIPLSLLNKLPPEQALNALVRITQALIGKYGYQKDHPARYATMRPGFAKSRQLAPEFSQTLRTLFEQLRPCSDKQLVKLFEPLYVGHSKQPAANKLIETFHLANLKRPLVFAMFRAAMEGANEGTDCPTWGDSFDPIEDEAEGPQPLVLLPGDAWSNAALASLKEMNPAQREAWLNLLKPSDSVEWSRPPKTWLKNAAASVEAIPDFSKTLSTWLSFVGKRGTRTQNLWAWPPDGTYIRHRNARTLRALIWSATTAPTHELAAAIGDAAVACDQKVLRLGPRSEIVRNAAIAALAAVPASIAGPQVTKVSLLAKYKTSKKLSTRAVQAAANQHQVSIPEFMEIAVPTYNFNANHSTTLAGGATLRITGSAKVQTTSEETPREAREIERLLTAHRVRIDRLLISGHSWPIATWRERYGDHPLLSYMSRRLIWTLGDNSGIWNGKSWLNSSGKSLRTPETIRPWHPASHEPAEVLAWRKFLESQELIQPFKQAHREIYLLTDAERATRTYSNRFAAHILRGPQFRSLMRERGWGGDPVIAFDTSMSPASLDLPDVGLTAVFTTHPADEEADSRGFFRHVSTDRVEFHRNGQPIPLEEVPPLTFTEVMRDIDLFVGVASVGNNPEWHDGGPDGRFRQYWWTYGIADLSASGISRRDLLSRLLPRLKLASTCSLTDKFLTVRGHLRTYKIHLGSGNIFMDPNDQYLCIVPGRGDQPSEVMLPFEGDRTLAIILSKAFMLAEDDKISDPTITRQIKTR